MGRKSDLQKNAERLLEINDRLVNENKDLRDLVRSKNVKHSRDVRALLGVILFNTIACIGILVYYGIL